MSNGSAGDVIGATSREFASGQKVFGRFTLIKILGRGAMGIVWLARDEELEREVALKFLPDLMIQDHAMLGQLKREAKRCLELTHPHIVRIHDFIHDERSGCISMEYIDGETLSNLRAEKERRVFEPDEIASWISQLCDALDYAHNHANIIHCDLKPANLMANQRGELKVSDFGIARSLTDSVSRLTMRQGRSGTLVYMSPQQLNGERVTPLDDIYSLGASMYELLTSKPPFYSGNIDRQICERVAPSMMARRKELDTEPALVPQIWEDTVAACLAKDPSQRPQSAAEVAERLQLASGQATRRRVQDKRLNRKALLVGSIAALSVLALAGVFLEVVKRHAKSVSQAAAIPEKSIAVLPFENLSEEKANQFFADGVQDEILTDLARIADLKVISRTSVMQYKTGIARNLREIGQQLGVANVVEGRVQRSGNRVRVNAQLVDTRTDRHVWAQTYDRDLADVFAIQSEIAKTIADQLQAKLSPREQAAIERPPTSDITAFDLYTRAKTSLLRLGSIATGEKPNVLRAIDLLNQAVARDPYFFDAYCLLAFSHYVLYFEGFDHTSARLALADAAVQAASGLRPDAGETHLARAQNFYLGYLDYDGAMAELELALQTVPNDPRLFFWRGMIQRRQGRWDESIRDLELASKFDPRNLLILEETAFSYRAVRRYDEERATRDRVLAFEPNDAVTKVERALIEMNSKADTRPLHQMLDSIRATDPAAMPIIAEALLLCALAERDAATAKDALTALGENPVNLASDDNVRFNRPFIEGIIALMAKDDDKARLAFTAARAEQEKIVRAQPNYALAVCVLGLIDATLGRKDEALREGRRAVELLPSEKDALDGSAMIKYSAMIAAWVGDKEPAFEQLATAIRLPTGPSYGQLKLLPLWDPLRGDPRFEKLAEEAKQPVVLK